MSVSPLDSEIMVSVRRSSIPTDNEGAAGIFFSRSVFPQYLISATLAAALILIGAFFMIKFYYVQ